MSRLRAIAEALRGSAAADAAQARRMAAGFGVAGGFFVAVAGYALGGSGAWLLALPLGAAIGWWLARRA